MALYWPDKKVALDIVDDPARRPFEGDDSYTVLRVTCADLSDYDSYYKVMERLSELLGTTVPTAPGWKEANRAVHDTFFSAFAADEPLREDELYPFSDYVEDDSLSNVQILATSAFEAERMRADAHRNGQYVRGVSVWEGPVPPGSFEVISDTMRMSTPEYFFFRKANQLPFAEAVSMGVELCGKYRTVLTQYDRGEGYDFIKQPRTTKAQLRRYLRGARGTKEGKRAKRILRFVSEECCSPMGCHLFLLLCLPKAHGSYGFERAMLSGAYDHGKGFMPASSGEYLAYDLCWPDKLVALQYTGAKKPTERQLGALNTCGMRTLVVTDNDICDPERFDAIARKLAQLLGEEPPEPSEKWLEARTNLRDTNPVPTFTHMRLTMADIGEHR